MYIHICMYVYMYIHIYVYIYIEAMHQDVDSRCGVLYMCIYKLIYKIEMCNRNVYIQINI
jgi:hypothetical protein